MSAVNLSTVTELFTQYDVKDTGKLSAKEIANAAYELLTDADTTNDDAGSLFATFVLGGKDEKGLLPDFDKDGLVSAEELKTLAGKSGSADRIGSADLQAAFTDNYKEGGTAIDTKKLADLAGIETPEETETNTTSSLLKQFLPMLLMMMMRMFMGGFGGGFPGGGYPGGRNIPY